MRNILKWGVLGGVFAVPFVPFVISNSMLFPFITGKGFVFRIIVEIIFALFILLVVSDTGHKENRPKMSFISKSVLVFLGIIFVADIFGENSFKSFWSNYERMEGFVALAHFVAFYFIISTILHTEKMWDRFWNTSLFASVLMSLYGVLQLFGKITINQGGVRLDGTFGNSSYLAIYLVFHIFIALLYFFKNKENNSKWFYIGIIVLNTITLYFTATRGAILGLLGGVILSSLIVLIKDRDNGRSKKIAKYVVSVVLLFIILFIGLRNTSFVKDSPVLSRFASLSFSEIKTQGRYYVWPMAIEGVKERPILGWGQENFNYVFNKYYNPAMYNQEQWFDRTHNVVLDWMIAGGILGFLAYLSMFVSMFYLLWRKSDFTLTEKSILTGLVSAYLFHNMFVFDNIGSYILFFSILAYIHQRSIEQGKEPIFKKEFSLDSLKYIFAPVVGIVLVIVVYFVNIPAINTAKYIIQAISQHQDGVVKNYEFFQKAFAENSFGKREALEQLVSASVQVINSEMPSEVKQNFFNLTKTEGEKQIETMPRDARYLLMYGSFLNRVGDYDNATIYLKRALENSPKKPTMSFELGASYLGKKDYAKAFELFEFAYNLEPRFPDSPIIYAVGAIYAGKKDVLNEMLSKLPKDIMITDERFLQTYFALKDYNTALYILNERLKLDPNNPQTNLSLAALYVELGNKNRAIEILRKVIKDNPSFKDQGEYYINQLSQ